MNHLPPHDNLIVVLIIIIYLAIIAAIEWPWRPKQKVCGKQEHRGWICATCATDERRNFQHHLQKARTALVEIREASKDFKAAPGNRMSNTLCYIFTKAKDVVGLK